MSDAEITQKIERIFEERGIPYSVSTESGHVTLTGPGDGAKQEYALTFATQVAGRNKVAFAEG
ncbi:BON domain-containing protein [Streptomyces sp. NPDC058612]|uniref:BON domain-containing protein n=1 Tax=Streptomyces sp. NPDC058612 TaxID=3346555 RepID=UPI003668F706